MKSTYKNLCKTAYYTSQHTVQSASSLFRLISPYNTEATKFVNSKSLSSPTDYLIWVDTNNFKTNIFQGTKDNWKLIKSYLCSIGKPSTPTPKGLFKIGLKGDYFGKKKGYICKYYTRFNGNYLFHSIIYNLDGTIRDGRLGMAISDGCIRLATPNAKWIWNNIPKNTTVYIT